MTHLKRRGGKVRLAKYIKGFIVFVFILFLSLYFHDFIRSKAEH